MMQKILITAKQNTVDLKGHDDSYFCGNGTVGISGDSNGVLSFCIGPDYTCPNFIESLSFSILKNGCNYTPDFHIRRIRGSGVFFGECEIDNEKINVFDFAPSDTSASLRLFCFNSDNTDISVVSHLCVPKEIKCEISNGGITLIADESVYCFGNRETLNWKTRSVFIPFSGSIKNTGANEFELIAKPHNKEIAFLFNHFYDGDAPFDPSEISPDNELKRTLAYWKEWLESTSWLHDIISPAADVVESLLLCVKMQQNRDGGMIAGIRKYANSYIRDTHGGMRLLLAAGHTDEVLLLLRNIKHKWEKSGFLPNWWSMGSDSFIGHSFCCDASEITAYYLFMLRDYMRSANLLHIPEEFLPSATWAVDTQVQYLLNHDMIISFNGDETEQYCCNNDGEEYGTFINPEYAFDHSKASFPSMSAALESIRFFDSATGSDHSELLDNLQASINHLFWTGEDNGYIWSAGYNTDGTLLHHKGQMTNYKLLPLWLSVKLTDNRQNSEALLCKRFIRENGFLPNCPECMQGFCGHTMGLMIYDMLCLGDSCSSQLVDTVLNSGILSIYGTVSEFYGPGGVPNGHNCRPFEGGILGEALIMYLNKFFRRKKMKYLVVLCDGMADLPFPALGNKTPMELAKKPNIDYMAHNGEVGMCRTVAEGLKPGSDVANLSVMGYDPKVCYTGRSPLEAASIGINLLNDDVSLRCNLVTLSDDEPYEKKKMIDYCAGDISSAEAKELIATVNEAFSNEKFSFYAGVAYRHCLVVHNGTTDLGTLTPPHDISNKVISDYLSTSENAAELINMMKKSYDILKNHPINLARIKKGERPANSIWLWGEGVRPTLENFKEKFNVTAAVVSAVDLLKGIGKCAGMKTPYVEGATGYIDTNFYGKAQTGIQMFKDGCDLVYMHIEAPDECGHRGEAENKVRAIELIDEKIVVPITDYLKSQGDYRVLVMPDHPTPLSIRTHSSDSVPYLIYDSTKPQTGTDFTETAAKESGNYVDYGPDMMKKLLGII